MNHLKNIFVPLVAALLLAFALTACGGGGGGSPSLTDDTPQTRVVTVTPENAEFYRALPGYENVTSGDVITVTLTREQNRALRNFLDGLIRAERENTGRRRAFTDTVGRLPRIELIQVSRRDFISIHGAYSSGWISALPDFLDNCNACLLPSVALPPPPEPGTELPPLDVQTELPPLEGYELTGTKLKLEPRDRNRAFPKIPDNFRIHLTLVAGLDDGEYAAFGYWATFADSGNEFTYSATPFFWTNSGIDIVLPETGTATYNGEAFGEYGENSGNFTDADVKIDVEFGAANNTRLNAVFTIGDNMSEVLSATTAREVNPVVNFYSQKRNSTYFRSEGSGFEHPNFEGVFFGGNDNGQPRNVGGTVRTDIGGKQFDGAFTASKE